jgi:transcription antitermination factor NusG
LKAEKKLAEDFLAAYQAAFGARISVDALRKAISEMKDFLKYVTLELNMNYDDAQFQLLSDGNACVAGIARNVQELERLLSSNDALSALDLLSANPFEAAEKYRRLLTNFEDEKEQIFVVSTDTTSLASVKELKEKIVKSLDTMKSLLNGNGGE